MSTSQTQCCCKTYSIPSIILIVVVYLCGMAVIQCGVFVTRPGLWEFGFKQTTCVVLNSRVSGYGVCKMNVCDNTCYSVTPCAQINVTYNLPSNNEPSSISTNVYENQIAGVEGGGCSTLHCNKRQSENTNYVYETYLPAYGKVGSNYTCYYNPNNVKQVIIHRTFSNAATVLSLAIPTAAFLISCVALFIVCKYKIGKQRPCRNNRYGNGVGIHYNCYCNSKGCHCIEIS